MSFWKPEQSRAMMLKHGIARDHSWTYDPVNSMGNLAIMVVGNVAHSCLLHLFAHMRDLCPRAIEWIDLSLDRKEGAEGDISSYQQLLIACKAQAMWLYSNDGATATCADAFDRLSFLMNRDRAHARSPWFGRRIDELLACAFQAGRYADGIRAYENFVGVASLKLKTVTNPRQLAYMHCQQALDQRHDPSELLAAGRRVLQKNLAEVWLHNGQYLHAATWLKIVYWHTDPNLGPERTMLKAYDDMPTIPRPSFL